MNTQHVPNGAHAFAPLAEFDFDLFDIFERGLEVSAPITSLPGLDVRYLQLGHGCIVVLCTALWRGLKNEFLFRSDQL